MEIIAKNLWLTLTVILPGMVTYGTFRLVSFLIGYQGIDFSTIDDSVVLSLSVLLAIALIQQAIGIFIEALIAGVVHLVHLHKAWCSNLHKLFVERFSSLGKGKFTEDVLRTIGQFFLSLNLAVGLILILVFTSFAQNPAGISAVNVPPWLPIALGVIIAIAIVVACFRCWNAVEAVKPQAADDESNQTNK